MRTPWLLLDVSYLAYRAYHAMGSKLSHGDIPTTVIYGVTREIRQLQETFSTDRIAFAFDYGKPYRKTDFPAYKANRNEGSDEDKAARLAVRNEIDAMRKDYLPSVGFQNILYQKHYEADDVIAKVVQERPTKDFVIVSSDQDLYQLLSKRVSIYNPAKKELLTLDMFHERYGCAVAQWADVKAMAGCHSDCIPGIKGIGEKTAIEFLTGKLKPGKKFDAIVEGNALWREYVGLTSLPYPGMDKLKLVRDKIDERDWLKLFDKLGMESLARSIPGMPRHQVGVTRATLGVFDKSKAKAPKR